MKKILIATGFLITGFVSSAQNRKLQNGLWRAVLERTDGKQIVFNFETKDSAGKKILYVRNAAERLLVDDISFYEEQLTKWKK